jgi:hypothetical protein
VYSFLLMKLKNNISRCLYKGVLRNQIFDSHTGKVSSHSPLYCWDVFRSRKVLAYRAYSSSDGSLDPFSRK